MWMRLIWPFVWSCWCHKENTWWFWALGPWCCYNVRSKTSRAVLATCFYLLISFLFAFHYLGPSHTGLESSQWPLANISHTVYFLTYWWVVVGGFWLCLGETGHFMSVSEVFTHCSVIFKHISYLEKVLNQYPKPSHQYMINKCHDLRCHSRC